MTYNEAGGRMGHDKNQEAICGNCPFPTEPCTWYTGVIVTHTSGLVVLVVAKYTFSTILLNCMVRVE